MPSETIDAEIRAVQNIDIVPIILDTLCRLTGMGYAAVARVTEDRWVACSVEDRIAFGLKPGDELKVETTLCHEVRGHCQPIVIADVARDPVYADHQTPAIYGLQSYVSVPIVLADGRFFGTLCAIHPQPADVNRPEIINTFTMFAKLIASHLDAADRLAVTEASLLDAATTSLLREQFIAVLGHDLRNPLASIGAGVRLLGKPLPGERSTIILGMMRSSVDRMAGLIDNILDFARGRLGGGIELGNRAIDIRILIDQVVGELAAAYPECPVTVACTATASVVCDPGRIAQLLSNLLGNAIKHGAAGQPIEVGCVVQGDALTLSVTNKGDAIPASALGKLFKPFARGAASGGREGLGLGLYIAAEIARAHGGALSVFSSPERTCFTFTMPLVPGSP